MPCRTIRGESMRPSTRSAARGCCRSIATSVSGEPTVQVAHEALLARWGRLVGWIEQAREDLWTRRRLMEAAADWIRAGRDPGFLLSGSRRELFASWAASTDLRLDVAERELLDASLAEGRRLAEADAARATHERALERRAANRLRALVAVLAAAALVATSLSVVVYGQGETAREQGAIATARELAAASIGNLDTDQELSLLLAWQAANATSSRGYVVEDAMDALQWAVQAAHVAYPADGAPIGVRTGPDGPRGVILVAPDRLMALAAAAAGRDLSPDECRTYLHRDACAAPTETPGPRVLNVHTASGIVPIEQLASTLLAGTRVDVVSQLPVDTPALATAFEARTGIDVVPATGADADLEARIASGDLPDVAIVARPARVAELARAHLLVDLSDTVDVAGLRSMAGDDLVDLGVLGADGSWPAREGRLYGAVFAIESESLVWYPKLAFERAGYSTPRTWDELRALTDRMLADGRTPWCLGVEAVAGSGAGGGVDSGAGAAAFVEDLLLHLAGPERYDRWAHEGVNVSDSLGQAFEVFGDLAFHDGAVLGGVASATHTPQRIAAWPMFADPPGCWLHLAGGTDRLSWPSGRSATLAAFAMPAADSAVADPMRGRVYSVVVFHDRPEVRQFVDSLLSGGLSASVAGSLVSGGLWPAGATDPGIRLDEVTRQEGERLWRAIRAGTFRVGASDLLPTRVATAFEQGAVHYLTAGPFSLATVLGDIADRWDESK